MALANTLWTKYSLLNWTPAYLTSCLCILLRPSPNISLTITDAAVCLNEPLMTNLALDLNREVNQSGKIVNCFFSDAHSRLICIRPEFLWPIMFHGFECVSHLGFCPARV